MNDQISDVDYNYTPTGLIMEIKTAFFDSTLNDQGEVKYIVGINNVNISDSIGNSRTENVYDDKGLLIIKNHFMDEKLTARTKVKYFYYY